MLNNISILHTESQTSFMDECFDRYSYDTGSTSLSAHEKEYDWFIDQILNGKAFAVTFDDFWDDAEYLIRRALKEADGTRKDRINRRSHELWDGINAERSIVADLWNDYMNDNWDNFEPAC